jgi:hypothetical protein
MAADGPTLFAPPLAPVRLEPGREVTLGRSAGCDLRLPAADASRRHASVTWRGDRAVLRDLGSTNGTFLNGQRVEGEALLASGDRITIGGLDVLYWRVEPVAAPAGPAAGTRAGEAPTIVSFRPAAGAEALRGDLARVPLFAVLQMLELGSQTGCLEVEAPEGAARLWLEAGRLVHAEAPKARGLEAALAAAVATRGRFEFAAGSPAPERSFEASVTEVILEATRLLDEVGSRR